MSEGHLGDKKREAGLDDKTFCLIVAARSGAAKAKSAVIPQTVKFVERTVRRILGRRGMR